MNLGNFLRSGMQAYGRNVIWNQEQEERQLNMDAKRQQFEAKEAELATQQERMAAHKRIGQQISAAQQADASTVLDPQKQAAAWQKAATEYTLAGDLEAAGRASNIAGDFTTQSRQATLDLAKQKQMQHEAVGNSALDYLSNPTPESATAVAKAAMAAGENPLDIPLPGDPKFTAWVKVKRQAGMDNAQRNQFLASETEKEARREEAKQRHEDLMRSKDEDRKLRAAIQAGTAEYRADMLALRARMQDSKGDKGGKVEDDGKPMPAKAVAMQQTELDALSVAADIRVDLSAIKKQVDTGTLKLGPVKNLVSAGRNLAGASTPNSRNYASFTASLEKLRNDSLRLNKGVQTEGDSTRAWNEILKNVNDKDVVSKRLAEVQKINERAAKLRKANVNNIRKNWGKGPLDFNQYDSPEAAITDSNVAAPKGVDTKLWKHMTPEERKLWK